MCGISLVLSAAGEEASLQSQDACIAQLLHRRGPDFQGTTQVIAGRSVLRIHATLLQLRGSAPGSAPLVYSGTPTTQAQDPGPLSSCSSSPQINHAAKREDEGASSVPPATHDSLQQRLISCSRSGSESQQQAGAAGLAGHVSAAGLQEGQASTGAVLAYNGEIFGGLPVAPGQNDGHVLLQALCQGSPGHLDALQHSPGADVPGVLSQVRGPWALLFWDVTTQTLWFGRDVLGRRSLLLRWPSPQHPTLTLTSVAPRSEPQARKSGQSILNTENGPAAIPSLQPGSHSQSSQNGQDVQSSQNGHSGAIAVAAAREGAVGSRGAVGGGGDADDDEGADQAPVPTSGSWQPWLNTDCWQEVPPGLYSLTLLPHVSNSLSLLPHVPNSLSLLSHMPNSLSLLPHVPNSAPPDLQRSETGGTAPSPDGSLVSDLPSTTWQPPRANGTTGWEWSAGGMIQGTGSPMTVLQTPGANGPMTAAAGGEAALGTGIAVRRMWMGQLGGEQWELRCHGWDDEATRLLAAYERPLQLVQLAGQPAVPLPGSVPRNNAAALNQAKPKAAVAGAVMVSAVSEQQQQRQQQQGEQRAQRRQRARQRQEEGLAQHAGQATQPQHQQHRQVADLHHEQPQQPLQQPVPPKQPSCDGTSASPGAAGQQQGPEAVETAAGTVDAMAASNGRVVSCTHPIESPCSHPYTSPDEAKERTPVGVPSAAELHGPTTPCDDPVDYGVPPDVVERVLSALREAVRLRCRCIETPTSPPHTAVLPGHNQCSIVARNHQQPSGQQPPSASLPGPHLPLARSAQEQPPSHIAQRLLGDGLPAHPSRGLDHLPPANRNLPHMAAAPGALCHDAFVSQAVHDPLPPAPVLVLFSGGVDSTLLAALTHQCLPPGVPVDLSNVCFDGGRSPDRLAAISALGELRAVAPDRQWRLILTDATLKDVDQNRDHILALLHPAGTVMDLNIGAALWLAVRAQGRLHGGAGGEYRSQARVVLLGHGADEQCAGYGRHRTRFAEGGWSRLSSELALDVHRLWLRNLGRDDRLVADWSREARHPFLDETFMLTLLNHVPLYETANLYRTPGVGDKRVLRAALAQLGLPLAAARVKRAIQFGSRIGRLSNVREFGSNRKANKASAGGVSLTNLPRGEQ